MARQFVKVFVLYRIGSIFDRRSIRQVKRFLGSAVSANRDTSRGRAMNSFDSVALGDLSRKCAALFNRILFKISSRVALPMLVVFKDGELNTQADTRLD